MERALEMVVWLLEVRKKMARFLFLFEFFLSLLYVVVLC